MRFALDHALGVLMSRLWLLALLVVVPVLGAGNCNPAPTPPAPTPSPTTCDLSCPFGLKEDISGQTYCECRPTDECTRNRPSPVVNPATGACTGFPTTCDVPDGWDDCPRCEIADCGPRPTDPSDVDRVCEDDTFAGATCSRHEDGDCSWDVRTCPEDGEQCNESFCGPGFGCCNWSCSLCAPTGGACTQQACAPTN